MATTKLISLLLIIATFCSLQFLLVSCFEYQVGGDKGWVVPPSNDTRIYNDWASENRFQVGDTVRFRYRKDSIMEISEQDYKNCNSSYPNFFSNTGNTVYYLNRTGPFYFISGVSGHCEKGQKMIIKVMSNGDHGSSSRQKSAAAAPPTGFSSGVSKLVFLQLVLSYVASCVFF